VVTFVPFVAPKISRVNPCNLILSLSKESVSDSFLCAFVSWWQNRSKHVHFLQKVTKRRSFLTKNYQKALIFTPIFTLKTNMSYKITYFAIAHHPNFQNFLQKPLFS
jgi:hypothetical protein